MNNLIGIAQICALLILLQRGLEELLSRRNTRRLLERGAVEVGADYYPVVAVTHLGWIAALFLLIPASAALSTSLITLYLGLQIFRYWIIFSLGEYWTHRIITLKDAPIVKRGPYSLFKHPNYMVTLMETALLPLAFGQSALAAIFTAIWGIVLFYKISLEDRALASRR